MTSKEALQELLHISKINTQYMDKLASLISVIKTDLDILEILKKYLFEQKIINTTAYKINVCLLGANEITDANEIKLIKDWLSL